MSTAMHSPWLREHERALEHWAPGSIRHESIAAADWRFLLPSLTHARVLLLGAPDDGTLRALAQQAEHLTCAVVDDLPHPREGDGRPANVSMLRVDPRWGLPFASASFDLIASPGTDAARYPVSAGELRRLLRPGGAAFIETDGATPAAEVGDPASDASGADHPLWIIRRRGALRAAVPMEDAPRVARHLFREVFYGVSPRGRFLARASSALAQAGVLHLFLPGRAMVLRRPEAPAERPFGWVWRLGAEAGLELDGHRAAFFARGGYDSNKTSLFLYPSSGDEPEIIVKMTRAAEYNHRLSTEHEGLRTVQRFQRVEPGSYPVPLFLDLSSGLAVQGQTVVRGAPFRSRTTGRVDCPLIAAGIDWITRLGETSADPEAAGAEEVGTWMSRILDRFLATYAVDPAHEAVLRERVEWISSSGLRIPLVLRHGDAGTWNVLARPDGGVAFLDWEASDPRGLPLWDLFDFLRSAGTWIARVRGETERSASYEKHFLRSSAISDLQREAVERYLAATGVEADLVSPLFLTCWMHRALREAAWSAAARDEGQYVNLLRLTLRNVRAPGVAWMFS